MQKVLGSFRKVRFTQSTLRQASTREKKGPSLGKINVKAPHQRSPYVMKFEDWSHEETERQQRCARSKAWNLAKSIYKLRENGTAAFYSPAEEWVLPAASTKEPEEREFVVDSGASVHVFSKRDLYSAELETMRTSRSPTTVNGEVQTREEATVYVKELDLLVTVMLLEETSAVLSLGKLCEDLGYTCPHLLLHHLHHKIPYLTLADTPKIQYPKEGEVRVRSHGETHCIGSTENENKNQNEGREEAQSDLLHDLPD